MTAQTDPHAAARALVVEWRECSIHATVEAATTLEACAAALEAALPPIEAAGPGPRVPYAHDFVPCPPPKLVAWAGHEVDISHPIGCPELGGKAGGALCHAILETEVPGRAGPLRSLCARSAADEIHPARSAHEPQPAPAEAAEAEPYMRGVCSRGGHLYQPCKLEADVARHCGWIDPVTTIECGAPPPPDLAPEPAAVESGALSPCPFCGSEARIVQRPMGHLQEIVFVAECKLTGFCGAHVWYDQEASAVQAWNRRTPADRDKLIAGLRDELAQANAQIEAWRKAFDSVVGAKDIIYGALQRAEATVASLRESDLAWRRCHAHGPRGARAVTAQHGAQAVAEDAAPAARRSK